MAWFVVLESSVDWDYEDIPAAILKVLKFIVGLNSAWAALRISKVRGLCFTFPQGYGWVVFSALALQEDHVPPVVGFA